MISIRGLTKQFAVSGGSVAAIKGLDLEVAEGEFFVIIGASGSGKTTLLRCVAGLELPDKGTIRIAGQVISSDSPPTWIPSQHRKLGMVFQSYAVWPHLTVYENVALPLAEGAQRVARREVANRVREALCMVQLEEFADRSATLLSGGQQQRVALARAIAVNPRILLMDEPLSNLDARLREEVRGKIRELAKQLGSTVLYVTHDQVEAMAIADKIALMQAGELLQVGVPMELYHHPCRAEVAEFFGSVNWVKGRMTEPSVAETRIGPIRLEKPVNGLGEVLLGFRPENLVVAQGKALSVPNLFRASLRSRTFLGDQFLYQVVIQDQSFVGKSRAIPVNIGDEIRLHIDPSDVMVFPG
ncbi:ABC transporter ATP-binding protein [bacterium]|nr:MAG: ABC transporter ATP-binding protein [bacterium]